MGIYVWDNFGKPEVGEPSWKRISYPFSRTRSLHLWSKVIGLVFPGLDRKSNTLYSNKVRKLLINTRQPHVGSARVRKDNTDTQWSINQLLSEALKFLRTAVGIQAQIESSSCPGSQGNKRLHKVKDRIKKKFKNKVKNKTKTCTHLFFNPFWWRSGESWFGLNISIISQVFVFNNVFALHNGNKYAFEKCKTYFPGGKSPNTLNCSIMISLIY